MGTDTMTAVCQNPDCGHPKAQHSSSGLCTDEECWNVGSDDVRDSTCRAFVAPVAEPEAECPTPWHCGTYPCEDSPSRAQVLAEAEAAWVEWDDSSAEPYRDAARYGWINGFLAARGVEQ